MNWPTCSPEALGGLRKTLESSVKPTCWKDFKNSSGPLTSRVLMTPTLGTRPMCLWDHDVFGEKRGEAASAPGFPAQARGPSQSKGLQPAGDSRRDAAQAREGWGREEPKSAPHPDPVAGQPRQLSGVTFFLAKIISIPYSKGYSTNRRKTANSSTPWGSSLLTF